ncbi:TetR family transcriptional regulator C-terminal domain-containing protein [Phytoactinopolyspora endophytica]|uniref:TetR family transcriptional regulator C-terminal domain-containing protein n=1 Tax=Phytoactinopolyspora endophytica TaxID=1642495 RepID=UPI0013ED1D23|nr:TetR family transcriptional regulator C-terminal domain-containing protein [Phytoactinopolyspora endophytica]
MADRYRDTAHDEKLRAHSVWLAEHYRAPFDEAVRAGIEAERFRSRQNPAAVVDVLIASMDGLLFPRILGHTRTDPAVYREVVLDQLAWSLEVTR